MTKVCIPSTIIIFYQLLLEYFFILVAVLLLQNVCFFQVWIPQKRTVVIILSPWEVRKIGRRADLSDFWKGQIIIAKWLDQKQRNPFSNSEYLPNTVWAGEKKI